MKAVFFVVVGAVLVALQAQASPASDANGLIPKDTAVLSVVVDKARCLLGVLAEAVKEVAKLAWVCGTSGPYLPICAITSVRQFIQDVGFVAMDCFSG